MVRWFGDREFQTQIGMAQLCEDRRALLCTARPAARRSERRVTSGRAYEPVAWDRVCRTAPVTSRRLQRAATRAPQSAVDFRGALLVMSACTAIAEPGAG
jgi:hypothetical protein